MDQRSKSKLSIDKLSVELLNAKYNLDPFDSGDEELNDFLKQNALREQQEFLSKTHLCFYKDRIAGFITLSADSVQVKLPLKDGKRELNLDKSQLVDNCNYPAYPCILIARLAVDKKLHGYGVGSYLLSLAIGFALESPLGCRYLAVDPKEGAVGFYEKWGFRYLTKSTRRMFLNIRDVARQLEPSESLDPWSDSDV